MDNRGFAKGMIIGGIIGASVGTMMSRNGRGRKKMAMNGRDFLRKSGRVVADVMDFFR